MAVFKIEFKNGAKMMHQVTNKEEYLELRNSPQQQRHIKEVREEGREEQKRYLVQMNYSCLPNPDGSLKGSKTPSNTVGMDIDHINKVEMEEVKNRILARKEELGLMMLEESARGMGYHLVFKRRGDLTQEENLRWASELIGVPYDEAAKDITRVFFTTTGEDLIYLDDELFCPPSSPEGATIAPPAEPITTSKSNKSFPTSFKGIPYSSIIKEYWQENAGEPTEGERNVKLYQLAQNLRAICDNNKQTLLSIMPRYGLTEAEMQSIIDSACKEPVKGISKKMQQIIALLSPSSGQPDTTSDEPADEASVSTPQLNVKKLPLGLKESLVGVPERMHMPVLCGVMPIAAAYADQVEVEYCDGNRQHLGLMSIIRGEQASNKSVVKNAIEVWQRQFSDEDTLARKREDEWREARKSRKANEKAPEDPRVLIRMLPVTVSCSTLLKRLKYAQGHTLYSFCEELDTLHKTNGAGSWSSKYDVYRLAFDRGEWGQDYNSDLAESGVAHVAYNWTMLGTDGALRRCFRSDNIENGLSSRVLVAQMPDASFAKLTKFKHRTEVEEQAIQEAVTRLRSYSGFIDTPRLRKAIEQWVEEKRVEAAKDIDHVKDTYRKRAAVIGFRCGVVHHLLTTTPEQMGKESNATLRFATLMAQYCLDQQIMAFGDTLHSQYIDAENMSQRYSCNHSVFDQLAPVFTTEDLIALKGRSIPRNTINKILSRWKKDQWVEKVDDMHWKKLQAA
ncbi:MAG: DUF3987 domain-containing protein [Prevotella sp.]|nr:DUF3987 domain-containing protein [Prevotella sp.]